MAKKTEVQAEITVKDAGSAVLKRIKDAFLGAADASEEAQQGALGFAQQVAATALGTHLPSLVEHAKQIGIGFFHAGVEAQGADQAVSGLIASVQGIPWDEAYEKAGELGDQIDDIAVNAGQLGSDVSAAFNAILELSGATEEGIGAALTQTKQITTIANVLGKSAEGIAREFALMQEGALETKGQLFQLLQSTGIFGDKVKEAAGRWSQMTEESRVKSLAYGLGMVSDRLSKATPTIGDYLNTLDNLKGIAIEKFSEPLARELEPALKSLIGKLKDSVPAIEKFAQALAKDAGEWVKEAVDGMEKGFQYIRTHHEEIRDALKEGWETAKSVVEFIIRNKEAIALAFGAHTLMPLGRSAIGAAGAVATGARAVYQTGAAAAGAVGLGVQAVKAGVPLGTVVGTLGSTAVAAAPAIIALSAAIAGLAVAAEATQAIEGARDIRKEQRAQLELLAATGQGDQLNNLVAGMRDMDEQTDSLTSPIAKMNTLLGMSKDEFERYVSSLQYQAALVQKETRNLNDLALEGYTGGMFEDIAAAYNAAAKSENAAAQKYAATLLLQSGFTASALEQAGIELAGGIEKFSELFAGADSDLAALLSKFVGTKASAPTPAAPKIVMTGGQTFNIKQDFRDQDPDRVALVFERDIARMTERKIQAGTSSPFGV